VWRVHRRACATQVVAGRVAWVVALPRDRLVVVAPPGIE